MIIEVPDWIKIGKCSSCAFRQLESESPIKEMNGIINMNCPFILHTDRPAIWYDVSTFEEIIPDYPKGCPVKIITKKEQS